MFRRTLATLVIATLVVPSAYASCGASSCPIELHALTPFESGMTLDLSFQYIDQAHVRSDGSAVDEEHQEMRTINRLTALQFTMPLSSRFQAGVTVPFVDRSHEHIDLESAQTERWNFHSLGDIALQGRARLFESGTNAPRSLWLTAALKLPTGSESEPAVGGGENSEVMISPGSGSVDAAIGLAFNGSVVRDTKLEGPFGHSTLIPYFITAAYRHNGKGTDDYRIGHEFQLNGGSQYPINHRVDLLGQLNLRVRGKDDPGQTEENPELTGGTYLYASPGVRVDIGRSASFYGYVQLPLYQRVNGTQLTSHVNYLAGVRQHF